MKTTATDIRQPLNLTEHSADDKQFFTLVFEGDITKFEGNPLRTLTPFGVPFAVGVGNAFDMIENIHEIEDAANNLLSVILKNVPEE